MKKLLIAAALAAPLFASAAANLLTDGSFESGLTFWTPSNTGSFTYQPTPFNYATSLAEVFEVIAPDNAVSMSPDAAGLKAVWFVEDSITNVQTLVSQNFTVVSAGSYNLGFSAYATAGGYGNTNDAVFSGRIDGVPVGTTTMNVSGLPNSTWTALTGVAALTPGLHNFSISFAAFGAGPATAKDITVDRAYVTAVPEPESYAMLALGLAFMGAVVRRGRRRRS